MRPGAPLIDRRADARWRRAWREIAQTAPPPGYPDSYGLPELRAAIADYLARARGVVCRPDEVLVTSGTRHGLRLLLEARFAARARIGVEDPGYRAAVGAVRAHGAQLVDCRVDEDGLVVDELPDRLPGVYTTPAHAGLVERVAAARSALGDWPSWPLQRALLAMFADGAVDQAVRRGRRVYADRCARVCAALERTAGSSAGMPACT